MTREIYCLRCPRGCLLQVEISEAFSTIQGNSCKLGEEFAIQEIRAPRRLFTSSVQVKGGKFPLVPVMTSAPILKEDIPRWISLCHSLSLEAPIEPNTVIARDPFGDGIDLITTWFA
ncbi:MAG: DUF1667 domain-containing protein [Brevinematales bacterium]|nr:DUF1667 domain-containing protein [Brevinematales bacterium]